MGSVLEVEIENATGEKKWIAVRRGRRGRAIAAANDYCDAAILPWSLHSAARRATKQRDGKNRAAPVGMTEKSKREARGTQEGGVKPPLHSRVKRVGRREKCS
jgi:hypothetical protein